MLVRVLYQWRIRRLKARTPRNRQLGLPVVLNSFTDAHSAPHSAPPSRLAASENPPPSNLRRTLKLCALTALRPTKPQPAVGVLEKVVSMQDRRQSRSPSNAAFLRGLARRIAGKAAVPPCRLFCGGQHGGSQAKPQPLQCCESYILAPQPGVFQASLIQESLDVLENENDSLPWLRIQNNSVRQGC